MPTITVIEKNGAETQINTTEGWSVMEVLRDHKVEDVEGICGGSMACATCHVYIHPDWMARVIAQDNEKSEAEDDILELAYALHENSRLSCQLRMSDALDGLIVALPGAKIKW